MKETFAEICTKFEEFKADGQKAVDGNKAAGVRARKVSLEVDRLLKEFRGLSTGRLIQ